VDLARLLVVDDDILIRRKLMEDLPERGFHVDVAASGPEALDQLGRETYDAVLLDHQLKEGPNGLEVLTQIRALPDAPEVVFLTAHGSIKTAVEAMKRGARDFVEKPYELDQLDIALKRACEMRRLSRQVSLLTGALRRHSVPPLTAHSPEMKDLLRVIEKAAPTDSTVLIQGETGTGKELVANDIYRRSARKEKLFLPINCGALQEQLLESELFGHEKGAFTGAAGMRHGLFEVADGGTIFLDEIGEMHPNTQVRLLRVLQSGEVRRVGGNQVLHVNVRVIASTNKDLVAETKKGTFREDLFYRLSVVTLSMPPLRDRKDEIPHLIDLFLQNACSRLGVAPKKVSDDALGLLLAHDWPGNVRELENIIELAVVLAEAETIGPADLPAELQTAPGSVALLGSPLSLEQVETQHLLRVLRKNDGNKRKTARDLEIDTKTLYNKLKKLDMAAPPGSKEHGKNPHAE
jgi:DNA-binding NtrC family response regulator